MRGRGERREGGHPLEDVWGGGQVAYADEQILRVGRRNAVEVRYGGRGCVLLQG